MSIVLDLLQKIICNTEKANITCEGENKVLDIHEAWFGRLSDNICVKEKDGNSGKTATIPNNDPKPEGPPEFGTGRNRRSASHCVNNRTWSLQKATEKCQGKTFCKFHVQSTNWIGEENDPCKGMQRYLTIKYQCKTGKLLMENCSENDAL